MSDWSLLALIFWGAFALDAVRRSRLARHAVHAGWLGGRAVWNFAALHLAPLLPWQWRLWADDPAIAFSPDGIVNQPIGASGRPGEPPRHAIVLRWEEIAECSEQKGWLLINGRRFAPPYAALPPARLLGLAQELAPLSHAAREHRLRRELALWFRPTHWQRRLRLLRHRTRTVAILNSITFVLAVALTVVACTGGLALDVELAPKVMPWISSAAALAFATWVAAIVFAFRAAKKLARWTRPGVRGAIGTALLFPPQALRWRTLISDAMRPAPHPLLLLAAGARRGDLRLAAFHAFTDLAHPLPLPGEASPGASSIRAWFAEALRPHLERTVRQASAPRVAKNGKPQGSLPAEDDSLLPEKLMRAPKPDGPASCAYCPRCHDQFVRPAATCPHGIELRKLAD